MTSQQATRGRLPGLVLGAVVTAAAGYGLWAWARNRPPEAAPAPQVPTPDVPPAAPIAGPPPAQAELPLPPTSTTAQTGYTGYPDGTWLPPLNGAKATVKHVFHANTPFTKVVGRLRDTNGREWYVHENGVRSTTYVDSTGRTIGMIEAPAAAKPILPEEGGR